ncbi:hypothetical protein G7Z17_g4575 [Cylindrodendrum hubeiense]|uniref:Protein kinase domain-containing protein n=1 Tax=Cylindrodendrum hubeiense TaxID=595255 RepID=A0A9P5HEM3_9HYPO|nr:hypothetical protein G7Z17_g4575 [Cylindrodendrum hubeiense]
MENILIVEAFWARTAIQVDFLKRVASTLEEEHCRIHIEVFEILRSKMMRTITKIESLLKRSPETGVNRWKLSLIRESLDETVTQLQQWQGIFDPTWYLILRIGDSVIDSELLTKQDDADSSLSESMNKISMSGSLRSSSLRAAQNIRLLLKSEKNANVHISLDNKLDWVNATPIPYSATQILRQSNSSRHYVVDSISCDSGIDLPRARADSEALAKKLQQVDPEIFGLLECYGLIKRRGNGTRQITSLDLVFRIPSIKTTPRTLRYYLMQPPSYSLTQLLHTAGQLARAVSFIHAYDFVHKNIRPETILLFSDPESRTSLGSAHLLGFDSFRSINFHTLLRGDVAWERNLYRHPSRQGLRAQEKYAMQHDVYSLGVCLLELGLWQSFVIYQASDCSTKNVDGDIFLHEDLQSKVDDAKDSTRDLSEPFSYLKEHLVDLARSRLPMRMGEKYTAVVMTCLTCMDEGNVDFGDQSEMQDEDGILIGVRFIEKVLLRLSEISF